MVSEYSEAEWNALDAKMENESMTVYCPRCGKELKFTDYGCGCEVKCPTEGCIKMTVRGI